MLEVNAIVIFFHIDAGTGVYFLLLHVFASSWFKKRNHHYEPRTRESAKEHEVHSSSSN